MSNLKALTYKDILRSSILINRRNRKSTSPAALETLSEEVQNLAQLFIGAQCPVYLAGGVSMALHQDRFYRNHKDFDIAIFVDDLPTLASHLESRGYELVVRYFTTHISPWHNIQWVAPLDINRIGREEPGSVRVRGMKKNRNPIRYMNHRDTYFDIFFQSKLERGAFLHWPKVIIPWDDFFPAKPVIEGSSLLLPNLNHKKHLPVHVPRQVEDFLVANMEPLKERVPDAIQ